ncbi:phosphatase PAP2 family protein [Shewanella mesophila]|uniref:phosphatase PAP2 family protein n=1 Tax=Shewanella mesophila TaxID=2864208 RepID=UPI001C658BD1|nr:phosphatase PAP2 family protein [Shewanella mesophila]QYJ85612.1 phosphatase PAP2 family protein [Shewanella mesophila]
MTPTFDKKIPEHYFRNHLLLPGLLFITIVSLIEWSHFDLTLSQFLFHLEGGVDSWPLRGAWLTETVIHKGGRNFVILLGLIIIGLLIASIKKVNLRPYRKGLIFIFLSVLSSVVLVRLGKSITDIDCPWNLKMFGGSADYHSLFSRVGDLNSPGQCFPAGHSSSGYAWVVLYFFALAYGKQYRWLGLSFGLGLGMTFGLAQQFRGAHFISHDLWSLAISWFSAALLYYVMFARSQSKSSPVIQSQDISALEN